MIRNCIMNNECLLDNKMGSYKKKMCFNDGWIKMDIVIHFPVVVTKKERVQYAI